MRDERENEQAEPEVQRVPAGGPGADSGAADAVGIDPDDERTIPNVASVNDIAGVGTRAADGRMEAGDTPDTDVEQERRLSEPGLHRADEDPGAARRNRRVAERDAGEDASLARASRGAQHLPRLAQNAPTQDEEIEGIMIQTQADLVGAPGERAREVLVQRLADAGLHLADDDLDALVGRIAPGGTVARRAV